MPPSHLHPRSRATSTLFASTLVASFIVVAVPHIWPCPRPRHAYHDSDIIVVRDDEGNVVQRLRRVRRDGQQQQQQLTETGGQRPAATATATATGEEAKLVGKTMATGSLVQKGTTMQEEAEMLRALREEAVVLSEERARKECPVPKPRGILGRLMGFEEKETTAENNKT